MDKFQFFICILNWLSILIGIGVGVRIAIGQWRMRRPAPPPVPEETPVPPSSRMGDMRALLSINDGDPVPVTGVTITAHVNCRCSLDFTPTGPITLLCTCVVCKTMHGVRVPVSLTADEKQAVFFQNRLCKKCKN